MYVVTDNLANIMQHSPAVQRGVYYRPEFLKTATAASNKINTILLPELPALPSFTTPVVTLPPYTHSLLVTE